MPNSADKSRRCAGNRSCRNSARLVRDVEIDTLRARALHLGIDRTCHDIARRERPARMYAGHKIFASAVAQNSAFAAHSLGDQKRVRLRMKKAGWMKLDELHIGDYGAGAPRHRHAIACRDVRVGRVEINLPATAGREDQAISADRFHLAGGFIKDIDAETAVFGREAKFRRGDQIDRHVIFEYLDVAAIPEPRGATSSQFRNR